MQVKRYKPLATVTFFTETGNLVARASNDPNSHMDDDVVSIQTNRDMGADAPTFTINLTRRRAWHKIVASNDLIFIDLVRPPEKQRRVFIGLVDDVRKRVDLSAGTPQRVISVTGRGVVKSLIQFDIGMVPESDYIEPTIGWLVTNGVNLTMSKADEAIAAVWDRIAKNYVNYKFSDGRTLFDIVQKQLRSRDNATIQDETGLINYQGSLWAFFKELADEPFNEIFWETDDEFPLMCVRPTPFNPVDWNTLENEHIVDEEVINEEIGRSDVETYTLYSVGAKTVFSSEDIYKTLNFQPLWYKPYAEKYGIRRLHVESLYAAYAGDSTNSKGVSDILQGYQQDLYNWNIKNNSFYNGTITVRGSARFKVGTRLTYYSVEEDESLEFYIRSVHHNFVNFGNWVTTLGVTRGCSPADRFTAPVDSYTTYDGLRGLDGSLMAPYDPEKAKQAMQKFFSDNETDMSTVTWKEGSTNVLKLANDLMNLGTIHYKYGGPGIDKGLADCSQFTQYVFKNGAGMDIGRTTGEQVRRGLPVDSKGQLIAGDLVFFKDTIANRPGLSHVGIYIGEGNFIQLSGDDYTGTINVRSLTSGYWSDHYMTGRRVLTDAIKAATGQVMTNIKFTFYGGDKSNGGAGTWQTATGTTPVEGRTIAVDPKMIALGSRILIEGTGVDWVDGHVFIAEDTGGAIKGNRIDIYVDDKQTPPAVARKIMLDYGVKYGKITLVTGDE